MDVQKKPRRESVVHQCPEEVRGRVNCSNSSDIGPPKFPQESHVGNMARRWLMLNVDGVRSPDRYNHIELIFVAQLCRNL